MHLLKKTWTASWRILLFVVLWGLLFSPAILVIETTGDGGSPIISPTIRFFLEFLGVLAVLVASWLMVRFVDRRTFTSLGFAPRGAVLDLLIGVALGSTMILISVATLWLAKWAQTVPVVTFSWHVLALMGAAMLLNAVTQEVLVRGYILQTIESQSNVVAAVVLSSVIFLLLHAGAIVEGGILPAFNLFAAGLLLGLAYTTTRSLWLPVALHFSWNLLQGPLLGIAVSGQTLDSGWRMLDLTGPPLFTGGAFGLEGGLVATMATTLGIVSLWTSRRWLGRNRLSPDINAECSTQPRR
jgi:membrane protease YdiL (CAAX protease family)